MLIFCIGSMAVLGAFEEGLGGYPTLLLTKSMMDGLISVALAATFGVGVMFSSIPVFLYQGSLTLAARFVQPYMTEAATIEMTATGGVMLSSDSLSALPRLLRQRDDIKTVVYSNTRYTEVLNLPLLLLLLLLLMGAEWGLRKYHGEI